MIPRQTSLTVFMILTHALAGLAAVVFFEAVYRGWWAALILAAAVGLVVGLYLRRDLELIESALQRLNDGLSIPANIGGRYPLRLLVAQIDKLLARERDTGAMREQLVQQVVTTAAQEERNRLARDLHDSIKQQIFSVGISAAAAQARWDHDPEGAKSALSDVRRSAQEAMVEMRALLQQLGPAPLEKVGLIQALRDQCEALSYRTGAQVNTDFGELPADERLPLGAQESIFRIAQEALGNVARHARAQNVSVRFGVRENGDAGVGALRAAPLQNVPHIYLEVSDDGQGFDVSHPAAGMGLGNMRARAARLGGTLELNSEPGKGASLRMALPLVQPEAEKADESLMSPYTRKMLNRAIAARWTGTLMLIVALALVTRQGRFGAILGLNHDQIVFGFQIAAALLMSGVVGAFIYAWQTIKPLIVSQGNESTVAYKYRYHVHRGLTVMCGACIVFVPVLPLASGTFEGIMIAIALAGALAVPLIYEIIQVYSLYDRYLRSLAAAELKAEIEGKWRQNMSNWFTIGALVFITIALSYNRIRSPFTMDGWLTTFADLTVLSIVFSHAGETWYYRRWRKRLAVSD
ncbi:MAG: sensor histidine kinase [Anaerolineae bacterium]